MSLITPIPNGPFYSAPEYYINSQYGFLVIGSGLSVTADGTLLATSDAGGTVTQVAAGEGLSGGIITQSGTISLKIASDSQLGGIKVGNYLTIAPDGTLNALPPGIGTITNIIAGGGLSGGGSGPGVSLNLVPATATTIGGVQIGSGIALGAGGLISLAAASATAVGGVQLATSVEAIAGVNTTKAITPATLASKVATTTAAGIVKLSDSVVTDDSTKAATSTAVKIANAAAIAAQTTADAALPKSGGTLTGIVTFAPGQAFPGVAFPPATTTTPGVVQVGSGLSVDTNGVLSTSNVGTVTEITAGPGLGAPASGNQITTTGTIRLLAPSSDGTQLGGVKAGDNIAIAADGTISVPSTSFLPSNNPYAYTSYIWPVPKAAPALPCPGDNGQVLTIIDNVTGTLGWTTSGALSTVTAGAGIAVATSGTNATVSLAKVTSVVPGTFGGTGIIPIFTVNEYGQITSSGTANSYGPFVAVSVVTPAVDLDFVANSLNHKVTLQGNTSINNPANAISGQRGTLIIEQNPLTAYSITWGSAWKFANGAKYNANATLASRDLLEFTVISGNEIVVTNVVSSFS